MKLLFKSIISALFLTTLALSPVQAATNKSSEAKKTEQNLKHFINNVDLQFLGIQLEQSAENKSILHFKYVVKNKNKRAIKKIHWFSYYTNHDKTFLVQEFPLSFPEGLKRNEKSELHATVAFTDLPKAAQEALTSNNLKLGLNVHPQSIEYTNGTKIIIAKSK